MLTCFLSFSHRFSIDYSPFPWNAYFAPLYTFAKTHIHFTLHYAHTPLCVITPDAFPPNIHFTSDHVVLHKAVVVQSVKIQNSVSTTKISSPPPPISQVVDVDGKHDDEDDDYTHDHVILPLCFVLFCYLVFGYVANLTTSFMSLRTH